MQLVVIEYTGTSIIVLYQDIHNDVKISCNTGCWILLSRYFVRCHRTNNVRLQSLQQSKRSSTAVEARHLPHAVERALLYLRPCPCRLPHYGTAVCVVLVQQSASTPRRRTRQSTFKSIRTGSSKRGENMAYLYSYVLLAVFM